MNPTLVRSDMRYWLLQPDARLRPQIFCYFVVRAAGGPAGESSQQPGDELLIPDGYPEIIDGVSRFHPDAG